MCVLAPANQFRTNKSAKKNIKTLIQPESNGYKTKLERNTLFGVLFILLLPLNRLREVRKTRNLGGRRRVVKGKL